MERDLIPTPAETRKRRLRQEMTHWLRIELEGRFGVRVADREGWHHLEDMCTTLINNGDLFDKAIQQLLAQYEEAALASVLVSPIAARPQEQKG